MQRSVIQNRKKAERELIAGPAEICLTTITTQTAQINQFIFYPIICFFCVDYLKTIQYKIKLKKITNIILNDRLASESPENFIV